jgi:hypothetical protein
MRRVHLPAALFLAASTLAGAAEARQIRETVARVEFDLPDTWQLITACNSGWTCVMGPGNEFNLRMNGTEYHPSDLKGDETFLIEKVVKAHLSNPKINQHAYKTTWDNFEGSELSGTGMSEGKEWRFTVYVMLDKKDAKRGVALLALGSEGGWSRNFAVAIGAVRKMRTY